MSIQEKILSVVVVTYVASAFTDILLQSKMYDLMVLIEHTIESVPGL
jgi:hypothetical protein